MEKLWKVSRNGKYLVSDYGDIINIRTKYELQHSPCKKHGYHLVGGHVSHSGTPLIHRIVYETFVGDIPEGLQINHLDGNKSNNHLSNLEVCTASENIKHAIRTGLLVPCKGEDIGTSKVTTEEVKQMYELFKIGYPNEHVGKIFGLHSRYVSLIRHGRRWGHLFEKEGMYRTNSLNVRCTLPRSVYIYNKCMTSETPQDALGKELGIDPSQVSRIRTGKTWANFRKHFGLPELTMDWKDRRDSLLVKLVEQAP